MPAATSAQSSSGIRATSREHPEKGNTNAWSYRKLIARVATTLENHGIAVFEIPENGTSRVCARHNIEVQRAVRGLARC